jgi:hypothetical protein
LTKSHKSKPDKPTPLIGGVKHDARGNAVWQWATETARHAVASTSQLLRRLDVSSLSLEELQDDQQPPKSPKSPQTASKPNAPAKPPPGGPAAAGKPVAAAPRERGFNPYDGAAIVRAAAPRKQPAVAMRKRAPWWRRLFQRR